MIRAWDDVSISLDKNNEEQRVYVSRCGREVRTFRLVSGGGKDSVNDVLAGVSEVVREALADAWAGCDQPKDRETGSVQ